MHLNNIEYSNTKIKIHKNKLIVKGKLGIQELIFKHNSAIIIDENSKKIKIRSANKPMINTYSTLIRNMNLGVKEGFTTKLKIVGLGYRATIKENKLILKLGFSHLIHYNIPNNIIINCIKPDLISIYGTNLQKVTKIASKIRDLKKPEPYKGKGIRYFREKVTRKETKRK
jgi:large subunit ribosomal protein L6